MSVAVIGDSSFITAFQLIGAYGFQAEEEVEIKETIRRLMDENKFKILIISERFAKATWKMRLENIKKGRVIPVFAILPDMKGVAKGERIKEIKSFISLATGVELK